MSNPNQSRQPKLTKPTKTSTAKELDNAFNTIFVSLETFLEANEPDIDRAIWSGLRLPFGQPDLTNPANEE